MLVVCLLLLAGCGGGSEQAGEPEGDAGEAESAAVGEAVNPWDLYTQAEAEAALGEKCNADLKDTQNPMGQKIAFYDTASEDDFRFIQVGIVQDEGIKAEGVSARQIYDDTKNALTDGAQPIEGIGEDAFWGTNGLHIFVGSSYINISTGNSSDPANLELAKQVAEVVLSRL